jgi:hypothetical protein
MKKPDFNKLTNEFSNGDILNSYITLSRVKGIKNLRFNATLGQLINQIAPYAKQLAIDVCIPAYLRIQELQDKTIDLAQAHDNQKTEEYRAALKMLYEGYKDVLNTYRSDYREYTEFLAEPFEPKIDFVKFKKENIPDDIPSEVYVVILPFIEKDTVPIT